MQHISAIADESIFLMNEEVKKIQTLSEICIYSHMKYEDEIILEEGVGGYTIRNKVLRLYILGFHLE